MSSRNVTDHLADHLAIRSLLDHYTDAMNRRDWPALERAFCRDGAWDAGGPAMPAMTFHFEGAAACAQGIAGLVDPLVLCVQSNHAPRITVDGDHATATSTINEIVMPLGATRSTTIWGMYFDEIVREADGEWRFKSRTFRFAWIATDGSPGQVIAQPPRP